MEMTENLVKRGLSVTVVEMLPQVMPLLDPEMVSPVHAELKKHGVSLRLNETVTGFEQMEEDSIAVKLKSGAIEETDLVILAIGVRPEISLAEKAGLDIGEKGGIRVNDRMRTSDSNIWAVGDAVEVRDVGTGEWAVIPLAGPANRQGRVAADVIMGRDSRFRGVQGTSVVGIMDLVVGFTGASEKTLKQQGLWGASSTFEKIYLHPADHAGYYPGSEKITLKLIFDTADGRITGAQAVGKKGVEKRIDVISMAIQKNGTVFDMEEAELCYAPQFGSAKDPVNMAGMIAANVIRGDVRVVHWEDLDNNDALILDVREPAEVKEGAVEGALNIPLGDLRDRMDDLSKNREIRVYCLEGQRSYYATRMLVQNGFEIGNLSGGYKLYKMAKAFGD
jgi:pyruvate/2-oxoglutarate dehydrogenase complex dihydrolipoamide dehydrogenase (E3) component/rhodanese-related sulfurtransferase